MQDFIEIFTRLIIAVMTFIAPVVIFLLNVFHEGIARINFQSDVEADQIQSLLKTQINVTGQDFSKIINESNKALEKNNKRTIRTKNRLNPKRQIAFLFIPLFGSLALIMFDSLVRKNVWNMYNHYFSSSLIILAIICFAFACVVLRNAAWAIIEAKQSIDQYKSSPSLESNPEKK